MLFFIKNVCFVFNLMGPDGIKMYFLAGVPFVFGPEIILIAFIESRRIHGF